jgi:hypothetical protein
VDVTDILRECQRELADVMLTLTHPHTPKEKEAACRILERCGEDLAEAAELLRRQA